MHKTEQMGIFCEYILTFGYVKKVKAEAFFGGKNFFSSDQLIFIFIFFPDWSFVSDNSGSMSIGVCW